MYRMQRQGWFRYLEFILLDSLILSLIFGFSYAVYNKVPFFPPSRDVAGLAILILLFIFSESIMLKVHNNLQGRDTLKEFFVCLEEVGVLVILLVFFYYVARSDFFQSRRLIQFFAIFGFVAVFAAHEIWKFLIRHVFKSRMFNKLLLIVTDTDSFDAVMRKIRLYGEDRYSIVGMVLTDTDEYFGKQYEGIRVLARKDSLAEDIQDRWVDDVFIFTRPDDGLSEKTMAELSAMGITTHSYINLKIERKAELFVEKFCGTMVVTENIRRASIWGLIVKRTMDIVGAIIGLVFTALITIIVGPMIFFADPGPIFFSQVRIGQNGKKFLMFKFRSMYKDAEERKKQLMEKNEIKGNMFKMENDPRIIGSGPDGTRHGIGWFIRKTSIDEFPQFWNILIGEMSLVGTRPPTVDEWEHYELHHRARMSFRPGLTGMWQVSGRSDITDFETVVNLDMEYIDNWSILEDIRIILKTVGMIFTGSGAK